MGLLKKRVKKIQLLALDIGSRSIKFAIGQEGSDRVKLVETFEKKLPPDIYDNGNILNKDALREAIINALREHKIHIKNVVVTLESTEMIKRELTIPKVDEDDRAALIAYEVNQYLPIDTSEYVIQHKDLGDIKEGDSVKSKVLLGAIPKELVKQIFDLLSSCGLNPLYLDMHSNSLEKLIQLEFGHLKDTTFALIDFGNKMIDISIYENGEYRFNRLIKMGGCGIDKVISDDLSISLEQAEERKLKTSIVALAQALELKASTEPDTESREMVLRDILAYLNECLDEINKVFKYHTSRSSENHIDKVYLHGGGAQFKDFQRYAKDRLDIDVEALNVFNKVELGPKVKAQELPRYANAIGALIRK